MARETNDSMPNYVLKIVKSMLNGTKDPVITVFGVAYKGGVEDTRETPALSFITQAENAGYKVKCYDPLVKKFQHELYSLYDATLDSDCIVLIADHMDFQKVDPTTLKMRSKNLVDTRNILDHHRWMEAGFNVRVLGSPKVMSPSSNFDYEFALEEGKIKILGRNE
jgi:UDP-N-acetyl-D-mannosaminuronic acid dehydrogenase